MWWALAAAAIPYVVSALQDKPDRPDAPARRQLPDRSKYSNDMLDSAFNPNNEQWTLASRQAQDNVNRALGRQGMAGSSVGGQLHANTQSKIAQAWLADASARKAAAFNAVSAHDLGIGNYGARQDEQQFGYEMAAYEAMMKKNQAQVDNAGKMAQTGLSLYNDYNTQQRSEQQRQENLALMERIYNPNYSRYVPTYGTPQAQPASHYTGEMA